MDPKKNAQEFSETLKKSGETLKQDLTKRGLDKDKTLEKKVHKINQDLQEASEYIKTRIEK